MSLLILQVITSVKWTIATVFATLFTVFLFKLCTIRSQFLEMRRKGLPMPPYNPVFGHLLAVGKVMSKLPTDSHNQYLPGLLRREYPELGPNFYMDTWPFGAPVLFVCEPSMLHQITQEHSLPKHRDLREFLRPLTNGLDIVTLNGQTWKTWRNIFNPGFSLSHLMTLTPVIVEEALVFCDNLQKLWESESMFQMKALTDKLTIDVIGTVALDTKLNTQRRDNSMINALKRQIRWLVFGSKLNPWERWHPFRRLVHWDCTRQMDSYLEPVLNSNVSKLQGQTSTPTKSIIGLALQTYLAQNGLQTTTDTTFRKFAISQVKLFLFSGHDTTSSTICYVFYLLSTHPAILDRVRQEHNSVFGEGLAARTKTLEQEPHLLNQLPITATVIKETLRLYPVGSSLRGGEPGYHITDPHGRQFPTDGFLVWAVSQPLHRDPAYWPKADEFIPDRWLVEADDPLHPVKGAWRPFEFGPRNCIGQELAMMEVKIVLLLVLQQFDVQVAYEEFDRKGGRGVKIVNGERAYQMTLAQPANDLPCRVSRRKNSH